MYLFVFFNRDNGQLVTVPEFAKKLTCTRLHSFKQHATPRLTDFFVVFFCCPPTQSKLAKKDWMWNYLMSAEVLLVTIGQLVALQGPPKGLGPMKWELRASPPTIRPGKRAMRNAALLTLPQGKGSVCCPENHGGPLLECPPAPGTRISQTDTSRGRREGPHNLWSLSKHTRPGKQQTCFLFWEIDKKEKQTLTGVSECLALLLPHVSPWQMVPNICTISITQT